MQMVHLQWVLTLDSFMHDALIFVLCSAVDFSKINTPGSKNSIDNFFFTLCTFKLSKSPYFHSFYHVMANNMAASNVKIGGYLLIDQSARA